MAETTDGMAQWLANWKGASARLAELRRQDLQHVDLAKVVEAMEGAFQSAILHSPKPMTSGLVQFQALLAKGRR